MTRSLEPVSDKKIIAVVGEGGSGKTCLTKRLVSEDPTSSLAVHKQTIDESHYATKRKPDGVHERLQLIDTAPWQEFPVMHRLYIRTCHLALVVYNVASPKWKESLMNMIQQVREVRESVDIVVVGTHSDEKNVHMNFTPAHVVEVIGDLPHVYVSSATSFGIDNLWHTMATRCTAFNGGRSILPNKVPIGSRHSHSIKSKSRSVKKLLTRTGSFLMCTSKYHTL